MFVCLGYGIWPVLVGAVVSIALTAVVRIVLDWLTEDLRLKIWSTVKDYAPGEQRPEDCLPKVTAQRIVSGMIETLIFFAALWSEGGWGVVAAWFAFKVAVLWQGSNLGQFPQELPKAKAEWDFVLMRQSAAVYHATRLATGTGGNLLAAFIGVGVGRWLLAYCGLPLHL